ncbi:MAG: hypothetical protein V1781_08885 [Bacteroidota bacterium]
MKEIILLIFFLATLIGCTQNSSNKSTANAGNSIFFIDQPITNSEHILDKGYNYALGFGKFNLQNDKLKIQKTADILMNRIELSGFSRENIKIKFQSNTLFFLFKDIKDYDKMRFLLCIQGKLEIWETYNNEEVIEKLIAADKRLSEINSENNNPAENLNENSPTLAKFKREHPLFFLLQPLVDQNGKDVPGPIVGKSLIKDTSKVMSYLHDERIKLVLADNFKFAWTYKPVKGAVSVIQLIALKVTRKDNNAALYGNIIEEAKATYDQKGGESQYIVMKMTNEASKAFETLTEVNIGKSIAIAIDGDVCSYLTVQNKISNGNINITGDYNSLEIERFINVIQSGTLPNGIRITYEVVPPK